jgi:hypothetical protein
MHTGGSSVLNFRCHAQTIWISAGMGGLIWHKYDVFKHVVQLLLVCNNNVWALCYLFEILQTADVGKIL